MKVTGIVWMGVRTDAYEGLRSLFGETMGMAVRHEEDGVTWFDGPRGTEIQIYDDTDTDHLFFGTGPTIGFLVEDFDVALADLRAAGIELIGDGDRNHRRRWQHFRGPDGNVYEILGPG